MKKRLLRTFTGLSFLLSINVASADTVLLSTQCQQRGGKKAPFMIVLQRGQNIHQAILQCANDAKLDNASIRGIGAIENPTLAYFDLAKKEYLNKQFHGIYELLALNGDVSLSQGKRMLHLHTVIGTRTYTTLGGHLVDGGIGVTGEVMITPLSGQAVRKFDAATGLHLIDATIKQDKSTDKTS